MALATARALAALLIALSLAAAPSAQVMDPQTGEPVPLGASAPPAQPDALRGGGEPLASIAHFTAGSTKLVRVVSSDALGDLVVYEDGADLLFGGIFIPVDGDGSGGGEPTFVEYARVTLPGLPTDAVARGDSLYVTLGKAPGLIVLDLTGLASPDPAVVEADRADLPSAFAVAVSEDRVYVGRGAAGVSVHARADLALLGSFDTPGSANGLAVTVFDFGAPGLVVADGNVASGDDVGVYDLSDPASPFLLTSTETDGFATYVALWGDVAFVTGAAGLTTISILDGSVLDVLPAGGTEYEVVIDDAAQIAYVNGLDGARAVDMSDPANLAVLATNDFGGQGLSIGAVPNVSLVLAADRFGGLRILDVSSLDELSRIPNGGFSHKPFFDVPTGRLFVTDLAGRLRTFSVAPDPAAAQELVDARTDVPANTQEVLVRNGIAYVTHAAGLTVLDVNGSGSYTQLTDVPLGQSYGMDLRDGVLYVAAGFAGLVALDVSDPSAPDVLSTTPIGANVVDVELEFFEDIAYVVSFGGGMLSYDVSDPAAPVQLDAEPSFGFLNAITTDGEFDSGVPFQDRAFVADGQAGLRIVDVSDPSDLTTISTTPTASPARDVSVGIGFGGDFFYPVIYVADDFFGIREFSVFGDPPRAFASADRGIGVAAAGDGASCFPDCIALAAGEAGVYLFEAPSSVAEEAGADGPALAVGAFPNPARDAATLTLTLAVGADVEVAVFDALGRRVAARAQALPAGAQALTLDTRRWAPGVYLARVRAGDAVATARLTVVR